MPVSRAESDSLNRFAMAARAALRQLELGIETELDRVEEVRKREQRVSRYYTAPAGGPALDLSSMAASYGDVFAMSDVRSTALDDFSARPVRDDDEITPAPAAVY